MHALIEAHTRSAGCLPTQRRIWGSQRRIFQYFDPLQLNGFNYTTNTTFNS